MNTVSKTEISTFRELVGNKIFTVDFIKKDGTLRTMNCRLGVKKHLAGGELSYNPDKFGYISVFDMQSEGYRTINLNTIQRLKLDGVEYSF